MTSLEALVQPLLDFTGRNPSLAMLVAFLAASSEAVPVAGAVIPGSAIVIGIGALVGLGTLQLWPILAAATLGAVAGDGLSYWFGRTYKQRALEVWPLSRHPGMIAMSERFFDRHGAKSVVIARFTPVVRSFVPLIAGISGMTPGRFYLANVVSAFAWAPVHVLPGAALGASLGVLGAASGRTLAVLAAVAAAALVVAWLVRLAWRAGLAGFGTAQAWLYRRLVGREGRGWGVLRSLVNPDEPAGRRVALLAGILAAAVLSLSSLVEDVLTRGGELTRADAAVANLVTTLRTTWSDRVLVSVTTLADTPITAAVALVTAAWLWWLGRRRLASGVAVVVVVTTLFALGLKATAHIPRPNPIYTGAVEFSFPSGHATFASAIYGVLGWLVARGLGPPWRTLVLGFVGGLIGAVAVSRIYLGAHWPSDVTAGLLYGLGATAVFALVFRSVQLTSRERVTTGLVALVAIVVIGSWHVTTGYALAKARYAPAVSTLSTMAESEWRDGGWQRLPALRIELGGDREDRLALQWAGDGPSLVAALAPHGWRSAAELGLATLERYLTGTTRPDDLPVLPKLNDGRSPEIALVRSSSDDRREVMRVWASRFAVRGREGPHPLLLASIVRERIEHPLGILTLARKQEDEPVDATAVTGGLPNSAVVTRPAPTMGEPNISTQPTVLAAP